MALTVALLASAAYSQTAQVSASPSYFASTGVRFNYYDQVLTSTTNFGIRIAGPATINGINVPNGFWAIASIDATPRSQSSSAGLRISAAYFLKAAGDFSLYALAGPGFQTNSSTTPTVTSNSPTTIGNVTVSNVLGSIGGGAGLVWNACKSFNANSKVNCNVMLEYSVQSVTTQTVKPVLGLYIGTSF